MPWLWHLFPQVRPLQSASPELQESSETYLSQERVWATRNLVWKARRIQSPVSEKKNIFNNLAVFDSESTCVPTEELTKTQTTCWIGKHVPTSVFLSSTLIEEPIFLYYKDPQKFITDFVSNLELLAEKFSGDENKISRYWSSSQRTNEKDFWSTKRTR